MYHREKAYNSFNPALRCDSPLSSQMSEKSTTPGREGGKREGRGKDTAQWRIKAEGVEQQKSEMYGKKCGEREVQGLKVN